MHSMLVTTAAVARRYFRTSVATWLALLPLASCGSADPHKTFADASSTAATVRMLVDARVKGHVTHDYTQRLLEAERQEAHSLASELPYERVAPQQRAAALATMSRLALVLDQLATDESSGDDEALARDGRGLDTLNASLDSLSAPRAR
jgi:hypothetical protein